MCLDSIAFDAEKDLSIPIHCPQEDFAILLVVQMQGETTLNKKFGTKNKYQTVMKAMQKGLILL